MSPSPASPLVFLADPATAVRHRLRIAPLLAPGAARWRRPVAVHPLPRRAREVALDGLDPGCTAVLPARLLGEFGLAALRRRVRRLVLDLDDPIFLRPSDRGGGASRSRARRFEQALEACDALAVATPALEAAARERSWTRRPTWLIPNPAPPASPVEARASGEALRLLWIGSQATLGQLEAWLPPLAARARTQALTLHVLADARPAEVPGLELRFERWTEAAEAAALAEAEVGLMPLLADPWSQLKSGYKLLVYIAAGLPVITDPGGGGAFIGPPGYPYFARGADELVGALSALSDPGLRERWGRRLQLELRRFATDRVARRWERLAAALDR